MKTKLLALVLSVLMIVSIVPLGVFAAPSAVTVSDHGHEHEYVPSADLAEETEGEYFSIYMEDDCYDSWNEAYITILKDGEVYVDEIGFYEYDMDYNI